MRARPAEKLLCLLLAFALFPARLSAAAADQDEVFNVVPAAQHLEIDGRERDGAEIYNINNETYYRLRDIAMLLRGTPAAFSVDYDATTRTVLITTGRDYTPAGGELAGKADHVGEFVKSNQTLVIDGTEKVLKAYNTNGTNFFRIRDLGTSLGFGVDYDAAKKAVLISTERIPHRVRLGTSDFFLLIPYDCAPRETGGYESERTGVSLDIYEFTGVANLRALAEKDAASVDPADAPAVTVTRAGGFEVLCYTADSEQVYYLDSGGTKCEKLVFQSNGADNGEVPGILGTLSKTVSVRLGDSLFSLSLPDAFSESALPDGANGQTGAYADGQAKRYIDIYYNSNAGDFDAFASALGKDWGREDGSLQRFSLIVRYYTGGTVPAQRQAHGVTCCMPCAIDLGGGKAATVVFRADDADFGWALDILGTLSAS